MERLDELGSGVREKTTGEGMELPLVASPAAPDQMASLSNTQRALFNMPRESFIHLGPATRREKDPTLSKFM